MGFQLIFDLLNKAIMANNGEGILSQHYRISLSHVVIYGCTRARRLHCNELATLLKRFMFQLFIKSSWQPFELYCLTLLNYLLEETISEIKKFILPKSDLMNR